MGSFPIKENHTWNIHDSSKIQCFMECPRKYFYRYMLGWEGSKPNIHLIFGEAWHRSMEHLLLNGYDSASIQGAYEVFMEYYRQHYDESTDLQMSPKSPLSVLPALIGYTNQWVGDDFEVLHTEVAGTVPIGENRFVNWRIDAVVKGPEGVFCLEHKTGSRLMKAWSDQWFLSMQVGTYSHVLYCLYDKEDVYGVKVNGTIFRKRDTEFIRVPIRKSLAAMKIWLHTVNHYMDMLKWNFETLAESSDKDDLLQAFPMNTTACTKYGTCQYFDFCTTWNNPLQKLDRVPLGFEEKWWNPADREEGAKKLIHIKEEKKDE
jgi:hypothetical protein